MDAQLNIIILLIDIFNLSELLRVRLYYNKV